MSGRTFAAMKDYQLDENKEIVALGTMKIIGSITSCCVATGVNGKEKLLNSLSPFEIKYVDFIVRLNITNLKVYLMSHHLI